MYIGSNIFDCVDAYLEKLFTDGKRSDPMRVPVLFFKYEALTLGGGRGVEWSQ